MDRTEFFKMAQKVAVYTKECEDLSKPLLEDCVVVCNGVRYYPQFVQVGYNQNGGVENIAILHDLQANSQTKANLSEVDKAKKV